MKITLPGEPKSTNHIYKMRSFGKFVSMYMSAEGKKIKSDYTILARSQFKQQPIADDLEITVTLYFGTKRKHDIDNYCKLLLDSLTGVLWVDDSQITKMTIEKLYSKENPRIELVIHK